MSAKIARKPILTISGEAEGAITKNYVVVRDATNPEKLSQASGINDGEVVGIAMNTVADGETVKVCALGLYPGKAGDTTATSGKIALANAAGKVIGYAAGSTGINSVGVIWSDAAAADELVTLLVCPAIV